MYCEECGQDHARNGHANWCNTLKPGYQSFVNTVRQNLSDATQKIMALEVKNDEYLGIMNNLHSLLSLVLHRHLPRNLDSLQKDIEKSLSVSDVILRPWWKKRMNQPPGHTCEQVLPLLDGKTTVCGNPRPCHMHG